MSDDGRGSRGSSSAGGSRGRASSIIAGRRPAAPKAGAAAGEQPRKTAAPAPAAASAAEKGAHEEGRPKRRRRRPAGAKPATATTAATTAAAPAEEVREAPQRARRAPAETRAAPEPAPIEEFLEDVAVAEAEIAEPAVIERPALAPARGGRVAEDGGELATIRRMFEEQRAMVRELRVGFAALEQRVELAGKRARLGVFVDVPNLLYGQDVDEKPINVGKLLALLTRNRDLVRATAYSPVSDDPSEPIEHQKFVAPFVPYEYRIVTKPLKRFADGSIKGNFDVEMAIDMVTMADRLDVIAIVSGDADFARAVETVQSRGVRVEVVAFARSTSLEMRALADHYVELGVLVDQLR